MPGMTQPDPASYPPPAGQPVVPAAVPSPPADQQQQQQQQPENSAADPPTVANPVPVAEQKEAGVAPEDTVTMADQRAGVLPPPEVLPDSEPQPASGDVQATPDLPPAFQPNEGAGAEAATPIAHPGVTNASPGLTPSAQASAARTYAWLTHIEDVIHAAKADIERFVPPDVLAVAQTEAVAVVRGLI